MFLAPTQQRNSFSYPCHTRQKHHGGLYAEDDERITHHIVDRPVVSKQVGGKQLRNFITCMSLPVTNLVFSPHLFMRFFKFLQALNRKYVQPQWVYDCINAQKVRDESKKE